VSGQLNTLIPVTLPPGRFNRPGGNVTGISVLSWPLTPKRLELLRELVPTIGIAGGLVNPNGRMPNRSPERSRRRRKRSGSNSVS
ncbi:MAG TPA: hypothetical protein VKB78_11320, partial [Pirellulales bacterium]|nr:hypothetical protein [Pirellulales bacterium]